MGAVLPQLTRLTQLNTDGCVEMGDAGDAALAVGLPPSLQTLEVTGIGAAGAQALAPAVLRCDQLTHLQLLEGDYGAGWGGIPSCA